MKKIVKVFLLVVFISSMLVAASCSIDDLKDSLGGIIGGNEDFPLIPNPPVETPEKQTYYVYVDYNNGTVTNKFMFEEGETFELPKAPYYEGYMFGGWMYETGELISSSYIIVDRNIYLTATWTWIESDFVITFVEIGSSGSFEYSYDMKLPRGYDLTSVYPKYIDEHMYEFVGWYTDPYYNNLITEVPSYDCTVYAKYNKIGEEYNEHYRTDNRDGGYELYAADGGFINHYDSLYKAINDCVKLGIDYYVVKDGIKMFVNSGEYSNESTDMFWQYENGASLDQYKPWLQTYWTDAQNEDYITIFKNNSTGQLEPYANSWECVNVNPNPVGKFEPGFTQTWNSCWNLEASSTVDLVPYSGITVAEYTLDLSSTMVIPSYSGSDKAWAYFGFITADSYNISHMGLRCDPDTGNWYYYSGEVTYNSSDIKINTNQVILTSWWDEANEAYRPNSTSVTMKIELLKENGHFIHRLTIMREAEAEYIFDYDYHALTQCATIRFTSGLDIVTHNSFPDYMCGAEFKNLVVTEAYGEVLPEMTSIGNYGTYPEITTAGRYDLLNSNGLSTPSFHTFIYTPSCVEYDFNTKGRDVYSYSYDLDYTSDALSSEVMEVVNAIDNAKTSNDYQEAKELYKALNEYQQNCVYNKEKLEDYVGSLGNRLICKKYQNISNINIVENSDIIEISVECSDYWCGFELFYDGVLLTKDNINLKNIYSSYPLDEMDSFVYWDVDTNKWFIKNIDGSGKVYDFTYDINTNTLTHCKNITSPDLNYTSTYNEIYDFKSENYGTYSSISFKCPTNIVSFELYNGETKLTPDNVNFGGNVLLHYYYSNSMYWNSSKEEWTISFSDLIAPRVTIIYDLVSNKLSCTVGDGVAFAKERGIKSVDVSYSDDVYTVEVVRYNGMDGIVYLIYEGTVISASNVELISSVLDSEVYGDLLTGNWVFNTTSDEKTYSIQYNVSTNTLSICEKVVELTCEYTENIIKKTIYQSGEQWVFKFTADGGCVYFKLKYGDLVLNANINCGENVSLDSSSPNLVSWEVAPSSWKLSAINQRGNVYEVYYNPLTNTISAKYISEESTQPYLIETISGIMLMSGGVKGEEHWTGFIVIQTSNKFRLYYKGLLLTQDNVNLGDNFVSEYEVEKFYWDALDSSWTIINYDENNRSFNVYYNPVTNTLYAN